MPVSPQIAVVVESPPGRGSEPCPPRLLPGASWGSRRTQSQQLGGPGALEKASVGGQQRGPREVREESGRAGVGVRAVPTCPEAIGAGRL